MKKRFLFRKCLLAVGLLTAINPLSSCSMFFGGDEFAITDTDVKTDENGNTIVTVTFSGENVEPLTFTIPATTKGIESVTATNQGDQVVLTINYNDGTNQQIGIPVINGQDGVGISSVELIEDVYGDKYIQFTYTNGKKSDKLPLPKGDDGVGVLDVDVTTEGDITTFTMTFTDDREPIVFSVKNGVSITNMYLDTQLSALDPDYYHFVVEFSDGESKTILADKPKTNKWLNGVGAPSSDLGEPQDFYVDLSSGWVYLKSSDKGWEAMFSIKGENQDNKEYYMVRFHLLEGEYIAEQNDNSTGPTILYYNILSGNSLPTSSIPVPQKDGYTFLGWYQDPLSPNSGQFTDLTQVNSSLDLYAKRENEKDI